MIATNDLKNILLKAVKANLLLRSIPEIVKDKHKPVTEESVAERIVIVVNATENSDWQKSYARVLVYVPSLTETNGNKKFFIPHAKRLAVLERECIRLFFRKTLIDFNGETLYYKLEDIVQESEPETWSDYLNVRLKITNSNFKL